MTKGIYVKKIGYFSRKNMKRVKIQFGDYFIPFNQIFL